MDLNQIPFKLRFNRCHKLYNEIQYYIDELDRVVQRKIDELRDKNNIQILLEENFTYIGQILKLVLSYLYSTNCQIEKDLRTELIEKFEDKIRQYLEDQQEYLNLKNIKQVNVLIERLPKCWKCLTWKNEIDRNEFSIKNYSESKDKNQFENNPFEQTYEKEGDLDGIYRLLRLFDNKIEFLKQKISLVDEMIIMLFNSSKEYMKILLKFDISLSEIKNWNEQLKFIQTELLNPFCIVDKIDFFSNSPDAYELTNKDVKLKLELKQL